MSVSACCLSICPSILSSPTFAYKSVTKNKVQVSVFLLPFFLPPALSKTNGSFVISFESNDQQFSQVVVHGDHDIIESGKTYTTMFDLGFPVDKIKMATLTWIKDEPVRREQDLLVLQQVTVTSLTDGKHTEHHLCGPAGPVAPIGPAIPVFLHEISCLPRPTPPKYGKEPF